MPSINSVSRRALYGLAESSRFQGLVRRNETIERRAYRHAQHYLGGRTLDQALASLERLHAEGFDIGIDYFGEAHTSAAAVGAATDQYLQLNRELAELGFAVNVWVDLTNVGLDISEDLCRRQIKRIAGSLPSDSRLQVRAHDSTRIDRILSLVIELADEGAPVMPTLQANLRRSPEYAERLIEAGLPVLLVKGAFLEPADLAHPWGEETDYAFLRLAHQLHTGGAELAIGTHDPVIREALLAEYPGLGVEMLLGIRTGDARELLNQGQQVRLYVPYGEDWLRYWLRRLGEGRGA